MEAMGTSRSGKLIANSRLDLFPSALGCVSAAWLSGHRKRGGGERETLLGGDARRDPLIVTGSSDGQLYVWDLDEGHARGHQNEPGGQGSK